MQLLIPAIVGLAFLGGGALAVHHSGILDGLLEDGPGIPAPDVYCHDSPLVPWPASANATAPFTFLIENTDEADQIFVCLFDTDGVKRFHRELTVPAETVMRQRFDAPAAWYYAQSQWGGPRTGVASDGMSAGNGWTAGSNWEKACEDGERVIPTTHSLIDKSRTTVGSRSYCEVQKQGFDQPIILPSGERVLGPGGEVAAWTALGVGGLGLVMLYARRVGWLALFTRLQKPMILEHDRRQRMVELIESDPGVHATDIASTLELSPGVTNYHLNVLTRAGVVSRVGFPGFQHYFLLGKFSPARMRALAFLRRPTVNRVFQAIDGGSVSLTELSDKTGLSIGRLSRIAKDLERFNVVRRRSQGRRLVLERLPLPA